MYVFGIVDPEEGPEAYKWHREFAGANNLIFPRTWDVYKKLAKEGQVWCGRNSDRNYCAMAYYHKDEEKKTWEIGGIMVASSERKRGLGAIITRLALGHVLIVADPLASGERVIAHVHAENQDPRYLIEQRLKFGKTKTVKIPGDQLPGLRTDKDGFVNGDEYEMGVPDSLNNLAEWCEQWRDRLRDGTPARVDLLEGTTLKDWASDFREMAAR